MKGSLIINFDEVTDGKGGNFYNVKVNNVDRYKHYTDVNNLYSTFIISGDVVNVTTNENMSVDVYRRDYTTDDQGGDKGIRDTLISSTEITTGVTFTATTIPQDYNFEYRLNISDITCFNMGTGFNGQVTDIEVGSDGSVYTCGNFGTYKGVSTGSQVVKIKTNGNQDTTYLAGGFNQNPTVILIDSNDELYVGGDFTNYSGLTRNRLIRLNSDGSLDNTFNIGTGFSGGSVDALFIDSGGKILCGGSFTSYQGTSANGIIRLNTDGSIDTGFTYGTGFNAFTRFIKEQSNGQYIIAGGFTSYNGTSRRRIVRLNSDGTLDTSFTPYIGINNVVESVLTLSDGKYLVGGIMSTTLVRLNSDGTQDTSFPSSNVNNQVEDINQTSDGGIIINGNFTQYSGTTANGIVKINTNGTLFSGFSSGTGFASNNTQMEVAFLDSKIYVGGQFTSYNGTTSNYIVRLSSNGTINNC